MGNQNPQLSATTKGEDGGGGRFDPSQPRTRSFLSVGVHRVRLDLVETEEKDSQHVE